LLREFILFSRQGRTDPGLDGLWTGKMARRRKIKCYFSIILYNSGDIK
jgi:hypothetical protein